MKTDNNKKFPKWIIVTLVILTILTGIGSFFWYKVDEFCRKEEIPNQIIKDFFIDEPEVTLNVGVNKLLFRIYAVDTFSQITILLNIYNNKEEIITEVYLTETKKFVKKSTYTIEYNLSLEEIAKATQYAYRLIDYR